VDLGVFAQYIPVVKAGYPHCFLGSLVALVASLNACGPEQSGVPDGANGGDAASGGVGGVGGAGAGSAGMSASGGAKAGGAGGVPEDPGPARYRHGQLRSPITAHVAASMRAIQKANMAPNNQIFMKVGASGTVSKNLLYCFAGAAQPKYTVDLDGRDELQPTIDYFRLGDAAGSTPFDRPTLAAKVGQSAKWAIGGSPSPVEQEIAAINPRLALVNYGTNDMQLGVTHRSAMWPFFDNFNKLLDQLVGLGIVPIITGLNPRSDKVSAAQWVPTYNALVRGIAEARQVPFINIYEASVDLPKMGLQSDGLHGNAYSSGGAQPCVFTAAGLEYNYNNRNLLTLQVLAAVWPLMVDANAVAPDPETEQLQGAGSASEPFLIEELPFTHAADTSASPNSNLDSYPACNADQDESGPELLYRFELTATTAVRIALLDHAGVDVDLHLLDASASASGCIERDDRIIERTLQAGTYHLAIDTFTSQASPKSGPYQLVVLACEPGDPDC